MPSFTINGQTLQSLGIESVAMKYINMGEDTATLTLVDKEQPGGPWARKAKVVISKDGAPFFTGWVSKSAAARAAGDHGIDVTVSGPWWWLTRIVFGRSLNGIIYTSCTLFVDKDGAFQDVRKSMREVLDWARVKSGNAFAIGTIEPLSNQKTPAQQFVEGEYCDAVLKKIAAWCPESCLWVDYSQTVPVIHWTAPGARRSHVFTSGVAPLTAATLVSENGIAPEAVVIRYDATHTDGAPIAEPYREDKWPPTASVDTPGAAVLTLSSDDDIGLPMARLVYDSARMFLWSGSATTARVLIDVKPGDLASFSGRAEWTGSRALVQSVSFRLGDLDHSIEMGPPSHLGVSDLLSLFWWMKRTNQDPAAEDVTRGSFEVYRTRENGFDVVKIAPGFVNTGSDSVSPTWLGLNLSAGTGPFELFRQGYSRDFFLHIEWRPDTYEFAGVDGVGQEVTGYRATATGTVIKCEIVNGAGTTTAPYVNIATGAARSGSFYFPLATVREKSGQIDVTQHRTADVDTVFVPPNFLYLING